MLTSFLNNEFSAHWLAQNPDASSERILIVNTSVEMLSDLSKSLTHWTIDTATTSQAVFEKLQHSPELFDLILIDITTPNCWQIVRSLKNNPFTNKIPIILISEHRYQETIGEFELRADDYLIKPFSANELIARVKIHLELVKQRKALTADLNMMTRLHTVAKRFVHETDLSLLLYEILDAAISITNADKGNILLIDDEDKVLKMVASRGLDQPFIQHFDNCNFEKDGCECVFENNDRLIVEDVTTSPYFAGTPHLNPLLVENIRSVQSTPLKSSSGKVLGIMSTYYRTPHTSVATQNLQMIDLLCRLSADVIEKELWIKERGKWLEQLQESDRRKEDFLAVLSHELRNPLASISNSIFTLSHSAMNSERAHRAQATIERQVKKITRMVDDLLDITRINRNKVSLQFQFVDVNDVVHQAIEDHRLLFERANLLLRCKLADKPLLIKADPIRITQIIDNLLHNSMKFTMQGGETLVLVQHDDVSRQAIIRVIDNGVGIEPHVMEHIFEPFMQADHSLDRGNGGLGLGLALVKGLVEQHNGVVNVISAGSGKGTEVRVKFPINFQPTNEVLDSGLQQSSHLQNELKILVIEDNLDVADSLCEVLDIYGYEVHTAHNGPDGIRKAKEIKPDLVICDIGLSGMNGFEVATIFKSDTDLQSIFLIAVSGYAQAEYVEKARMVGFDKYLPKPVNISCLEQLIRLQFGK